MATGTTSLDLDTLRRAVSDPDPEMMTGLFRDDAECILIDKTNPPSEPLKRRGREEIGEIHRKLFGADKTHRLDKLVASEDSVAFADACEYPDGTKVYCSSFLDVEDGKVSREVCVQAWDE